MSVIVKNPNICICSHTPVPDPDPDPIPCVGCDGCYIANDAVVYPLHSVGCNGSGVFNVSTFLCNEACDGAPQYQILEYDDSVFSSVTVDISGLIRYTFSNNAVPSSFHSIQYKTICFDSGGLVFGSIATLTVGVSNSCSKVICPQGQGCDPCTGDCLPVPVNLSTQIN